jgi:hypothetical protein
MIGSWELDTEATEKINPILAALKGFRYDFNADGTGAMGVGGPPRKATWKIAKEEGQTLSVELLGEGDKSPSVIEVTVVDGEHIKVNFPKGFGVCQLKRRPAGAKEEVEASKPDDPDVVATLKKTKAHLQIDPPGKVIEVSFPSGVKREEVLPALPHLKKLPNLKSVSLGYCDLTDEDLAVMKDLAQIKNLALNKNTRLTDKGLEHLATLTNLGELWLTDCAITDKGVEHLKGLTNLRRLDLEGTKVTDEGLANLKGMTKLQTLKLWATPIKGPGLANLRGLPKLDTLYISPEALDGVTPEVLKSLTQVHHMYATLAVKPEAVAKLKAALPGCQLH